MKLGTKIIGLRGRRLSERAFTWLDLVVVMMILILLSAGWGFNHIGERARIARCARNLQVLGDAMQSFANDHDGTLPSAGVEQFNLTWNMELRSYLPGQTTPAKSELPEAKSPGASKQLSLLSQPKQKATFRFVCPSDRIKRNNPRSYSMPAYNILPENWPPGPEAATGVGLNFSKKDTARLFGPEFTHESRAEQLEALPQVKLSWITDPANTLLLTEQPHVSNRLDYSSRTVITETEQINIHNSVLTNNFHNGCFNYLMVDGHAELLTFLETGSWDGSSGIWTIKKED
jgi:prepilin-type processing-associated H-X9-DG protein